MDDAPDPDRTIAVLPVAQGRRWMGVGATAALGCLLIWLGVQIPLGQSLWGLAVIGAGAFGIFVAVRMHAATDTRLVLTRTALRDGDGRLLAPLADVTGVERGAFVPKPSQGFLLRTRRPLGRAFVPGVWWRIGRTVGVGGVMGSREAKEMAALIEIVLAEQSAEQTSGRNTR